MGLSDKLQVTLLKKPDLTLLKKPDLTLQTAHGYCSTFEEAKLQKYKLNTPTLVGTECSLEFHPALS